MLEDWKQLLKSDWKKWLNSKRESEDKKKIYQSRQEKIQGVPKSRCAMCNRMLARYNRIQDPITGLNYCKDCARRKGLVE